MGPRAPSTPNTASSTTRRSGSSTTPRPEALPSTRRSRWSSTATGWSGCGRRTVSRFSPSRALPRGALRGRGDLVVEARDDAGQERVGADGLVPAKIVQLDLLRELVRRHAALHEFPHPLHQRLHLADPIDN